MKKIIAFVKDTILLGVAVLVPIAVVVVILYGTLEKLVKATTPITSNISFGGPLVKTAIAIVIVVLVLGGIFFISGMLLKSYLGNSFENWLEEKILNHIPFFKTVKNLTNQFTGVEKNNYTVVEVNFNENDSAMLGVKTETLSDGRHVVYCPFSPLINIGQMHIVSEENIKQVDLSLKEFTDVVTKLGFESNKIHKKHNK
jgi:uncharacterized membrane protein